MATVELNATLPSSSTFSFTAPFPPPISASSSSSSPHKQRRVSLALPSSPRLFPAWSFRDDTGVGVHTADASLVPEKKKMRRLEGGFERSEDEGAPPQPEKRQRKKWSMEETEMLVRGCNKWGVGNWKSILNDPEFKFDNRSPVDLKDRFRTYFPDAYKQHYPNAKTHLSSKVRSANPDGTSIFEKTRSKKRRPFTEEEDRALKAGYDKHGTVWATIVKDPIFQEQNRRSTDLRDRFRNAFPDLYQAAGYKPRNSAKGKTIGGRKGAVRAATDDQLASGSGGVSASAGVSAAGPVRRKRRHTAQGLLRGGTKSMPQSTTCSEDEESSDEDEETLATLHSTQASEAALTPANADMQTLNDLSLPDMIPNSSMSEMTDSSQSQTWSSNIDAWRTTSPTSSHLSSDYFLQNSPFRAGTMIGKSAWGPQDWLSANPRLESSAGSSASYASSPFSFAEMSHGVLDRYDLFPPALAHDFASEAGIGDTHSTFSDPDMFAPSSFRGFTHHSNYAGDLIFGARTHQPQHPFDYGVGFGFGSAGLGLSGVQQPSASGLHPMQLHTPALPGIDEIELTSITLEDQLDTHEPMEQSTDSAMSSKDDPSCGMNLHDLGGFTQALEDIIGLTQGINATPPGTPQIGMRVTREHSNVHLSSTHNRSVSVPPSEHRTALPRAAQTQVLRPRPLHTPPRPMSLLDVLPHLHDGLPTHSQPPPPSLQPATSYPPDSWRPQNEFYDVPFLDLHYYSSLGSNPSSSALPIDTDPLAGYPRTSVEQVRQGQALDLAESYASASASTSRPFGLPPALTLMSHSAHGTPPAGARMIPMHHRGQSAVSPQDLLLRKSNDNKRKRSSWDGGVH